MKDKPTPSQKALIRFNKQLYLDEKRNNLLWYLAGLGAGVIVLTVYVYGR